MSEKMRAILLHDFGGTEQLEFGEHIKPSPAPDELQIRILYAAVNPVDWKIRLGLLKTRMPHEFPIIPGWDAAGIVSKVGENVFQFKEGDEVFAYCRTSLIKWGTYAEYICVPAQNVAFKPRNISFAQAAAIPLAGLTAWQSLFHSLKLKPGETLLIHAGAGGVGGLALQFAREVGASLIITTAKESNHAYVTQLGAHVAIDYQKEDFVDAVKRIAPGGVDIVFDTVGGATLQKSFQVLKPGGRLASIVEPPSQEKAKEVHIHAHYVFVEPNGKQLQEIADLISQERVKPLEIEEMALEEAAAAQEKNQERHVKGKIVLKIA